jgi:hypothetical protein
MATQRTSFTKLQRDRAKKAKAAAKRERRLERAAEAKEASEATVDDADTTPSDGEGPISAAELLREIEVTHQRFEAKLMSYEEFEEKKAELLARLPID